MTLPNSSGGFIVLGSIVDVYYWGNTLSERNAYIGKTNTHISFVSSTYYNTYGSQDTSGIYYLYDTGEVYASNTDYANYNFVNNYSGVKLGWGVSHTYAPQIQACLMSTATSITVMANCISVANDTYGGYGKIKTYPSQMCQVNLTNAIDGWNYILLDYYNAGYSNNPTTWTTIVQDVMVVSNAVPQASPMISANAQAYILEQAKTTYENSGLSKILVVSAYADAYGNYSKIYDVATNTISSGYCVLLGKFYYNSTSKSISKVIDFYAPSQKYGASNAGDTGVSMIPIIDAVNDLKYKVNVELKSTSIISRNEYESLESKDNDQVYYISENDNSISQYLGEKSINDAKAIYSVGINNSYNNGILCWNRFKCNTDNTIVEFKGNLVIITDTNTEITVSYYYDNNTVSFYDDRYSINGTQTLHLSQIFTVDKGYHEIKVLITGYNVADRYYSYVIGKNLEDSSIAITSAEDYDYSVADTVALLKYKGTEEQVLIPKTIEGVTVSTIDKNCFTDTNVRNVIIPDGITTIN